MASYLNGTMEACRQSSRRLSASISRGAVLADGRLVISGSEYNFNQFSFTNLRIDLRSARQRLDAAPKHPPVTSITSRRFAFSRCYRTAAPLRQVQETDGGARSENNEMDRLSECREERLQCRGRLDADARRHDPDLRREGSPQIRSVISREKGKWISAGKSAGRSLEAQNCCGCIEYDPNKPCYQPPGEVGPAVLRPDGTVFATGGIVGNAKAHTDIWTPPSKGNRQGHWTAGPDFPSGEDAGDCFAALLPNGNVLVQTLSGSLYEFDEAQI